MTEMAISTPTYYTLKYLGGITHVPVLRCTNYIPKFMYIEIEMYITWKYPTRKEALVSLERRISAKPAEQ